MSHKVSTYAFEANYANMLRHVANDLKKLSVVFRKLRCDEGRPRCSNCLGREQECEYAESLADKVDRTTSQIMDKLAYVQANVDRLSSTMAARDRSNAVAEFREQTRRLLNALRQSQSVESAFAPSKRYRSHGVADSNKPGVQGPLTVPHKIMLWPNIRDQLLNTSIQADPDLAELWDEGSTWFIKRELKSRSGILPVEMSLPDHSFTSDLGHRRTLFLRDLRMTSALEYADAYFNTFNMLFPLLDRQRFMDDVISPVTQQGYADSSWRGVLALFVFALGQVAVEGTYHPPVSTPGGEPSGIRGGTIQVPPGLHNFNEARRRLNLLPVHDTLEKVQGLLLQSIYYQCSSQHVDYWHSVTSASMLCRVLIMCTLDSWESTRGDLIARAYWTCVIHEELFHVDMDLPGTAVVTMEDDVPLPHFHEMSELGMLDHQRPTEHDMMSTAYFLAMITLRRLVGRIHNLLDESESRTGHGSAPTVVLGEMSRQLEAWRNALPASLRWLDIDPPLVDPNLDPLDPKDDRAQLSQNSRQRETKTISSSSGLELIKAMLQARYYHAQGTLHLVSVYRAIHHEQPISADNAGGFVAAIRSACDLSYAIEPLKGKKRLVPHQFTWIQSFTGALLILRVVSHNSQLRALCQGGIPEGQIQRAESIMLGWLRDMIQIDGIAKWSWQILEPVYFTGTA